MGGGDESPASIQGFQGLGGRALQDSGHLANGGATTTGSSKAGLPNLNHKKDKSEIVI